MAQRKVSSVRPLAKSRVSVRPPSSGSSVSTSSGGAPSGSSNGRSSASSARGSRTGSTSALGAVWIPSVTGSGAGHSQGQ